MSCIIHYWITLHFSFISNWNIGNIHWRGNIKPLFSSLRIIFLCYIICSKSWSVFSSYFNVVHFPESCLFPIPKRAACPSPSADQEFSFVLIPGCRVNIPEYRCLITHMGRSNCRSRLPHSSAAPSICAQTRTLGMTFFFLPRLFIQLFIYFYIIQFIYLDLFS